jgi:hypothetical protein
MLISDVELPVDFTIIVFINASRALFILIVAEFMTELLPIVAPYIPVKRLFVLSHVKFPLLVKVDAPEKYGILFAVPLPPILLLNVVQSVLLSAPLLVALAVGRLNVCVDVADEILKSVPAVPVANVCVEAVRPFSDVMPPPPPPVAFIVKLPPVLLTVTFVPAVIPTTGSVTVDGPTPSEDKDALNVWPESENWSMVCISLVTEPSTSVPVTVIVLPAVPTVLMPPPAMVTEPPPFDKAMALETAESVWKYSGFKCPHALPSQ